MIRERLHGESGFTLIEILVAVGILVIVIGAVYGAFRAGSQSSMFVEEDADLHQTARVILGRITSELLSVHTISGTTGSCLIGKSASDLNNPDGFDSLQFTTVSHKPSNTPAQYGDVCTVTYSAECANDGTPQGLFLTEDYTLGLQLDADTTSGTSTDTSTDDSLQETKISDLVVGMKCQYLDSSTNEWSDDWVGQSVPPSAVHIELILQTKRANSQPISVYSTVYLPSWATSTTTTSTTSSPSTSTTTGN
jgi:prepilin-type N-terminal cleavage/methylation domain-containing protein